MQCEQPPPPILTFGTIKGFPVFAPLNQVGTEPRSKICHGQSSFCWSWSSVACLVSWSWSLMWGHCKIGCPETFEGLSIAILSPVKGLFEHRDGQSVSVLGPAHPKSQRKHDHARQGLQPESHGALDPSYFLDSPQMPSGFSWKQNKDTFFLLVEFKGEPLPKKGEKQWAPLGNRVSDLVPDFEVTATNGSLAACQEDQSSVGPMNSVGQPW